MLRDHRVSKASKVSLVQLGLRDHRALKGPKVMPENKVRWDPLAHRATKAKKVTRVKLALKALKAMPVQRVRKALRASLALLVYPDHRELLVRRAQR